MDLLDRLTGHDRWTTDALLERCRALPDEELDRSFDVGHETLRRTFDHLVVTIDGWTGLMTGTAIDDIPPVAPIDDLIAFHRAAYDRFEALAHDLDASGRLDETFVDEYGVRRSYGATILHVILHNATHRSEVLHILARLGIEDLPEGDPLEWEHSTGRNGTAR